MTIQKKLQTGAVVTSTERESVGTRLMYDSAYLALTDMMSEAVITGDLLTFTRSPRLL